MVISRDEIADILEDVLRREFRVRDNDPMFGRRVHLYDAGFVDSTGVVELIAFIERTFDVMLGDEDIFSDAFTTVDGISGVVHARLSRSSPAASVPATRA
jgi:acyl carrier protein